MFKKLLIVTAVVLGLIYGSGSDLSSLKHSITGTSNENARGLTGNSSNGWGERSGY